MKKINLLIVLLTVFLCIQAQTQENSKWKYIGPDGGSINAFHFNPQNADECFSIGNIDRGYIYTSNNGGKSWIFLHEFPTKISDFVIDPIDPNIIYVLGEESIYKTTDKGLTWSERPLQNNVIATKGKVVIDSINPYMIYVIGEDKNNNAIASILRSTDGAETWTRHKLFEGSIPLHGFHIAMSPSNPAVLYSVVSRYNVELFTYKCRVFKTIDGGNNWQELPKEFQAAVNAVLIDPIDPDKVYLGTYWNVYRSSDGGQNWLENEDYVYANALSVDPVNPNFMYAGYENCLYKSEDGGIHWEKFECNQIGLCQDLVCQAQGVFYASDTGIYKSQDGGSTWTSRHEGISELRMLNISVSNSPPYRIYAMPDSAYHIYKSDDFGKTWQISMCIPGCGEFICLEGSSNSADHLFAAAHGGG
ncbi:MAG: hypothetical protein JSV17_13945 [Candidatus Aminicenantes bacterium]|nr:MAG: hypothetical protein JSV17_13945 [Candidatus Aminicenantes bacterium]